MIDPVWLMMGRFGPSETTKIPLHVLYLDHDDGRQTQATDRTSGSWKRSSLYRRELDAMSSFFSKVLRRKRDDREGSSPSEGELLGGKFEDVSPNVSPSAVNFPELMTNGPIRGRERARSTDKDRTLRTLFRSRSRAASPTRSPRRREETPPLPQLSLNFFNDPTYEPVSPLDDSQLLLSESTIGARRLTPVEALDLIRACSEAIAFRGIDSLGIMTPHWYSASPDIQRRLISLFIHSLTSQSPLSAIPSFESEINSTRSPHDVAAVLRWGLRHLQLEGDTFGNHPQWYNTFFAAERMADHPPKAFSETLAPLIPPTHFNLLKQVLEIFSSFTIYSNTNSTSGSKLSKVFGLWLLNAHRVETNDDWQTFYDRWERTGRQLEHLFFAQIRDEGAHHRAPLRLLQLVTRYPYYQDPSPATDLQLLPRPTFTTRLFDALLVRVMTELPNEGLRPKSNVHPLRVVAEALSASSSEGELGSVWAKIVATSKVEGTGTPLARIFSDETIRLLALVPDEEETDQSIRSPTVALLPLSPISPRGKRRSFSLSEFTTGLQRSTSTQSQSTDEAPTTAITEDWSVFSSAGFSATSPYTPLASTLFGTDIERTSPPPPSRRPSRHGRSPSTTSIPRKSVDFHPETRETKGPAQAADHHVELQSRIASVQIVQLDEAFVDFWSDALLDPITSNWPSFVVCRIRPSLVPELSYGEEGKQKTVEWVVLEQAFTVKPPPSPTSVPLPPTPTQEPQERPVSPSSMSKKRFAFWSTSRSSSFSSVMSSTRGKKEKERALRVSEMGEVLEEGGNGDEQGSAPPSRASTSAARRDRERKRDSVVRVRVPSPKPRKSTDVPRKSIDAGIAASKAMDGAKDEESKVPVVAAAATAAAIGGVSTATALAKSSEEKRGEPEVVEETKEDEEGAKGVAEEGAQGEPKSIFAEKFSSEEVTPEADVDSKVEEPPAIPVEADAEPKEPEAPDTRSLDVVEEEPVQDMTPAVPVEDASQEPSVVEGTASPAAVTQVKEETVPAAPTEFGTEPQGSGTPATRALVVEEKVPVEEQQPPLPVEDVVQDTQVAPPAAEEPLAAEEATIPTAVEEVVEEDAILAPVEPTDEPEVEQVASVVSSDGAIAIPSQADEPILPATSTSEADAAPAVPLSQDDTPVDAAEAQGPQEDEHQEDISPNVADESQDPDPVQHSPTIEGPSSPQNPAPDAAAPDVHATTVVDDESTPTTPDETQEAELEVETPVDVQAADGVLPPSVSTEETAPAEEVVPSVAAQDEVEPQPEEASVVPEPSTIVEDDGVPLRGNEEPEHAQPSTVEEDRAILEPTEPTEEAHAPAEPIEDAADDTQDVPVPGVSLEDQEPTVEAEQSAPAVDENAQPIEASAIDLADDQASDSNVEPVAATLQEEPSVVEPEVEVQEEEAVVSVVEESADDQPKEEAGDAVLEAGQEESTEEAELKTEETSQDQPAAEAQMAETSDEVLEPSVTIESAEVAIIVEDVLPTEELPQTTASPEDDAKAELETTVPLAEPVDDVTPVACELDVEAKEEADVPSGVSQDKDKDGAPAIEAVAEPEEKGVSGKEEAIVAAPAESPDDSSADQVAADTEGSPDAAPAEEPSTVVGVSPVLEDVRPATPTVDEELKVEQASPVTGATEGLTEATADVGVESKDELPSVDPITEPSGGEQAKEETVQAIVEAEDDVEAKVVEEGEEVATEVPVVSDDEGKVEVPDVEPEVELKEEPVVEHAAEASIDEDSLAATESAPAPQDSVEQAAEPTEESCRSSPSPDPQEGPAAEVTAPSIEDVEPVTTTVEETSKSEEETSSVTEVVEDSPQEPLQEDEAPVEAEEQPAAEAIIAGPDTDVAPNDEVADSTTVEDQVEAEAQVEEVESSVPVEEPPAVEAAVTSEPEVIEDAPVSEEISPTEVAGPSPDNDLSVTAAKPEHNDDETQEPVPVAEFAQEVTDSGDAEEAATPVVDASTDIHHPAVGSQDDLPADGLPEPPAEPVEGSREEEEPASSSANMEDVVEEQPAASTGNEPAVTTDLEIAEDAPQDPTLPEEATEEEPPSEVVAVAEEAPGEDAIDAVEAQPSSIEESKLPVDDMDQDVIVEPTAEPEANEQPPIDVDDGSETKEESAVPDEPHVKDASDAVEEESLAPAPLVETEPTTAEEPEVPAEEPQSTDSVEPKDSPVATVSELSTSHAPEPDLPPVETIDDRSTTTQPVDSTPNAEAVHDTQTDREVITFVEEEPAGVTDEPVVVEEPSEHDSSDPHPNEDANDVKDAPLVEETLTTPAEEPSQDPPPSLDQVSEDPAPVELSLEIDSQPTNDSDQEPSEQISTGDETAVVEYTEDPSQLPEPAVEIGQGDDVEVIQDAPAPADEAVVEAPTSEADAQDKASIPHTNSNEADAEPLTASSKEDEQEAPPTGDQSPPQSEEPDDEATPIPVSRDDTVEIVHDIVEVDKITTPPAILEAAEPAMSPGDGADGGAEPVESVAEEETAVDERNAEPASTEDVETVNEQVEPETAIEVPVDTVSEVPGADEVSTAPEPAPEVEAVDDVNGTVSSNPIEGKDEVAHDDQDSTPTVSAEGQDELADIRADVVEPPSESQPDDPIDATVLSEAAETTEDAHATKPFAPEANATQESDSRASVEDQAPTGNLDEPTPEGEESETPAMDTSSVPAEADETKDGDQPVTEEVPSSTGAAEPRVEQDESSAEIAEPIASAPPADSSAPTDFDSTLTDEAVPEHPEAPTEVSLHIDSTGLPDNPELEVVAKDEPEAIPLEGAPPAMEAETQTDIATEESLGEEGLAVTESVIEGASPDTVAALPVADPAVEGTDAAPSAPQTPAAEVATPPIAEAEEPTASAPTATDEVLEVPSEPNAVEMRDQVQQDEDPAQDPVEQVQETPQPPSDEQEPQAQTLDEAPVKDDVTRINDGINGSAGEDVVELSTEPSVTTSHSEPQPMSDVPSSPVVIASATPRIEPLNLGPDDGPVDLEPVPVADAPVLPPPTSASAAFPDLSQHSMYETVPVTVLSPQEELASLDLPEGRDSPDAETSNANVPTKETDPALTSSLASAVDLPTAIEQLVEAGLTPSAEALLGAVQESLRGKIKEEDKPTSPPGAPTEAQAIPETVEADAEGQEPSEVIPKHVAEASTESDATLVSGPPSDAGHSREPTVMEDEPSESQADVKAVLQESPVPVEKLDNESTPLPSSEENGEVKSTAEPSTSATEATNSA